MTVTSVQLLWAQRSECVPFLCGQLEMGVCGSIKASEARSRGCPGTEQPLGQRERRAAGSGPSVCERLPSPSGTLQTDTSKGSDRDPATGRGRVLVQQAQGQTGKGPLPGQPSRRAWETFMLVQGIEWGAASCVPVSSFNIQK